MTDSKTTFSALTSISESMRFTVEQYEADFEAYLDEPTWLQQLDALNEAERNG